MDPSQDWAIIVELSSILGLDLNRTNLLRNDLLTSMPVRAHLTEQRITPKENKKLVRPKFQSVDHSWYGLITVYNWTKVKGYSISFVFLSFETFKVLFRYISGSRNCCLKVTFSLKRWFIIKNRLGTISSNQKKKKNCYKNRDLKTDWIHMYQVPFLV